MSMIIPLKKESAKNRVRGICANCLKDVYEDSFVLDDCYNVYAGECPYCGAINLLTMDYGLRGYDSEKMGLVLPYKEEVESNGLPKNCPTQGKSGIPATIHGSWQGELLHKIEKQ